MYACGQAGPPKEFTGNGKQWKLDTLFKHDFFACTARYKCNDTNELAVLKINRIRGFLGLPLRWIGRMLCRRELNILGQLQDLDQVPQLICPFAQTGFVYQYIEGQSLDEKPAVPDSFFDDLVQLLNEIHQRHICYVDANKRGNILLGEDGRPHLIDFQISLFLPSNWGRRLRHLFQREDRYHILKHKRKLRPDLLTDEEKKNLSQVSWPIRLHRTITGPLRDLRRALLRYLYKKDVLKSDSTTERSPENDPRRFLK